MHKGRKICLERGVPDSILSAQKGGPAGVQVSDLVPLCINTERIRDWYIAAWI